MTSLLLVLVTIALIAVTTRLRTVEVACRRPLAGVGHCDDHGGCGHMHYGGSCPTCGHGALVL